MSLTICAKRRAILEAPGHCLVLGGPGSGKTTLALLKAVYRSQQRMDPGQCVLFLSFSRAAVARISDVAKHEIPTIIADQRGLLSIQTFHSFFWHILQGYGYLLGAPRALRIVQAHEEASLRDGRKPGDPGWPEWEERRQRMFRDEVLACFDLFAHLVARVFQRAARIRDRVSRRYPLILVDEAQDTSDAQWACIEPLSARSQVVCLADPDQMIFAHLPGVSAARLPAIRTALRPLEVDLGSENNRSPGTEIRQFARDVFLGTPRSAPYAGVSLLGFQPQAEKRDAAIRSSIGLIRRRITTETGSPPESIAVLASYSRGVAVVSAALQKDAAIAHHVLFDESFVFLSARLAAFLLEPKRAGDQAADLATILELVSAAFRAKGTKGGRTIHERCLEYVARIRAGSVPTVKLVNAAGRCASSVRSRPLLGDPQSDWSTVKRILAGAGDAALSEMASQLDFLVAFARGRRIAEALSAAWIEHGAYADARGVLDEALAQDQLLSAGEPSHGVHVMNTHKAKGKQFDGVVLYRQAHHSPFVWRGERPPHAESRRLLHMAIARASKHVLVLSEAYPPCPILSQYTLR